MKRNCPDCARPLTKHCTNPDCQWFRCVNCENFGDPDGIWVPLLVPERKR